MNKSTIFKLKSALGDTELKYDKGQTLTIEDIFT